MPVIEETRPKQDAVDARVLPGMLADSAAKPSRTPLEMTRAEFEEKLNRLRAQRSSAR